MRPELVLCLSLATTAVAVGQSAPQAGRVTADSAVLRSGPSDQMPETGTLYRGTKVIVDHEDPGGWLAIQPPSGQVGWINHLHLAPVPGQPSDVLPRNMQVHAEPDAEVAVGRAGLGHPLDVRRARIPDGTIVLVIGHKVEHGGSFWYPVEPPHDDFRYVRETRSMLAGRCVRSRSGRPKSIRSHSRPPQSPRRPIPRSIPCRPSRRTPAGRVPGRTTLTGTLPSRPNATASTFGPSSCSSSSRRR